MIQKAHRHNSSFRDPSGFMFELEGTLYRQVNRCFQKEFDHFISSGCYAHYISQHKMVAHQEQNVNLTGDKEWYKTIVPEKIPFISYPWEWSFQMLKDAALLTLELQETSLNYGLSLKDATPFNIQFHQGQPIWIDTLSFEFYDEKKPWVAYRQFCEQFLSPLAIMHYGKNAMQPLSLAYPEGIPLNIAASLLPLRSKFSLHCYLHIHLNARIARKAGIQKDKGIAFSKKKMQNLLRSLRLLVEGLHLKETDSNWSAYYKEASQRNNYLTDKKKIVSEWIGQISPDIHNASDLGANDGEFSRIFAAKGIDCLAADLDPNCIDRLYRNIKKENIKQIHPLIQDLSNPTPSIGVNNEERDAFILRAKRDAVLALALIHHLAIGKNIPMENIAMLFAKLCNKYLILEFVPEEDERSAFMIQQKSNEISGYDQRSFEAGFSPYFSIFATAKIQDSERILYLFRRK